MGQETGQQKSHSEPEAETSGIGSYTFFSFRPLLSCFALLCSAVHVPSTSKLERWEGPDLISHTLQGAPHQKTLVDFPISTRHRPIPANQSPLLFGPQRPKFIESIVFLARTDQTSRPKNTDTSQPLLSTHSSSLDCQITKSLWQHYTALPVLAKLTYPSPHSTRESQSSFKPFCILIRSRQTGSTQEPQPQLYPKIYTRCPAR